MQANGISKIFPHDFFSCWHFIENVTANLYFQHLICARNTRAIMSVRFFFVYSKQNAPDRVCRTYANAYFQIKFIRPLHCVLSKKLNSAQQDFSLSYIKDFELYEWAMMRVLRICSYSYIYKYAVWSGVCLMAARVRFTLILNEKRLRHIYQLWIIMKTFFHRICRVVVRWKNGFYLHIYICVHVHTYICFPLWLRSITDSFLWSNLIGFYIYIYIWR